MQMLTVPQRRLGLAKGEKPSPLQVVRIRPKRRQAQETCSPLALVVVRYLLQALLQWPPIICILLGHLSTTATSCVLPGGVLCRCRGPQPTGHHVRLCAPLEREGVRVDHWGGLLHANLWLSQAPVLQRLTFTLQVLGSLPEHLLGLPKFPKLQSDGAKPRPQGLQRVLHQFLFRDQEQ